MKILKKKLELESFEYYKMHLRIVNPMLKNPLPTKKIELLAHFMSADVDYWGGDRFNSFTRKNVMKKLGLTPSGLSGHLRILINNGLLIKDPETNRIEIEPWLMPGNVSQGYQFVIIKSKNEARGKEAD